MVGFVRGLLLILLRGSWFSGAVAAAHRVGDFHEALEALGVAGVGELLAAGGEKERNGKGQHQEKQAMEPGFEHC